MSTNPLSGSLTATGTSEATPFEALPGKPINLTLSGTWVGTAVLKCKRPGDTAYAALTLVGASYGSYTANVNEPVWEEPEGGCLFIVDWTRTSGTLSYRFGQ